MINTDNGYVIAEAAIQHGGDVEAAKYICRQAKRVGADAVKFQIFLPDEPLFCPVEGDEDRWPRWEKSFMTPTDWSRVKGFCDEIGIDFLASAFQPSAVKLLKDLDVVAYKVASRAAEAYPYGSAPGPFIISTGMHPMLPEGITCPLEGNGYLLQCESKYPHEPYWFDGQTYDGLSDHSGSPWPSILALAYDAWIIEVHVKFVPDKDAAASVSLDELRMICDARDNFAPLLSD